MVTYNVEFLVCCVCQRLGLLMRLINQKTGKPVQRCPIAP